MAKIAKYWSWEFINVQYTSAIELYGGIHDGKKGVCIGFKRKGRKKVEKIIVSRAETKELIKELQRVLDLP